MNPPGKGYKAISKALGLQRTTGTAITHKGRKRETEGVSRSLARLSGLYHIWSISCSALSKNSTLLNQSVIIHICFTCVTFSIIAVNLLPDLLHFLQQATFQCMTLFLNLTPLSACEPPLIQLCDVIIDLTWVLDCDI